MNQRTSNLILRKKITKKAKAKPRILSSKNQRARETFFFYFFRNVSIFRSLGFRTEIFITIFN